jgi:7-carboxy-7-deazaguanine synthase
MRNPVDSGEMGGIVASLWEPGMHSVSVTGGEPLLQADEIATLLTLLEERGIRNYLETNGTLHEELDRLLPLLDWIAMDVKLPSSQGGYDLMPEHVRFLKSALGANVFLKMVITPETREDELSYACEMLSREDRRVALVLQPATSPEGVTAITAGKAARLHGIAAAYFDDVRVIPQMHRLWGIR